MAMQCLNDQQLNDYLRGSLEADILIPASEHIASCAACRARVAGLSMYKSAAWRIGQVAMAADDCPEYEVLSSFVDERLDTIERRNIERHIGTCEMCWRDIETLQAARSRASLAPTITVAPGAFSTRHNWTMFRWKSATAAVLSAAAAVTILVLTNPFGGSVNEGPTQLAVKPTPEASHVAPPAPGKEISKPEPLPAVGPIANNTPNPTTGVSTTPSETPKPQITHRAVVVIRDGDITVDSIDGKLSPRLRGRNLEAQIAAIVKEKLRTGKVESSFKMARADTSVLRGPEDVMDIRKISPAPDSFADARPEFRWEAVEDAERYRIEVDKLDSTAVIYTETDTPYYRPTEDLVPGTYKWTVWMRRGELAEWTVSKAAVFSVLSDTDRELLNTARRDYAESHLVMGTVYERLGMNEEARKEFEALAQKNPNSKLATKLLDGVKVAD